ncbi:outer membrane beta-barrel domain-containing protein [Hyalangium rubrum]|uniref:Outer membrane beta-barrel domain-containing protein n=1 Tax=Hyalangium rubrum TaxID=3103134 RepID=A0ABU5HHQ4_9BACT|nr:outer membrane beta-barrel domain-containing protein [Hyalangium sp. s54d21]MDY7232984.1 outer membrane beta-barrel domain-containing protein [Hyalangium sp. s54d21]
MRTILSFAVLLVAVVRAQPAFAQSEQPTVPAPGAETSIPPQVATPTEPTASPAAPARPEMGTAVPTEPTAPASRAPAPEQAEPAAEAQAPAPEAPPAVEPPVSSDAPTVLAEADSDLRTTTAEQQRLVHGAPLYNPNVAVHIVQKKRFADEGRHEFSLYPVTVQMNGRFTNHTGTALNYTYHLQENFALQVGGQYNWYSNESDFNLELIDKVREQAQAASSLLLVWGAQAGVEVTPLYGKFAFYDDQLAQFSLVITGGAGFGGARHLIRPEVDNQVDGETFRVPARFGDAGTKFLGSVGGGFRLQFGDSYAIRLEVKDLVYTARVDRVDGCNLADFEKMEAARASDSPFADLGLSGGCQFQKFDGVDPKTKKNYREDIILGRDLVAEPSSDVLNNVSFYAGFSVLF